MTHESRALYRIDYGFFAILAAVSILYTPLTNLHYTYHRYRRYIGQALYIVLAKPNITSLYGVAKPSIINGYTYTLHLEPQHWETLNL
jgi:hypothetical protein